MSAMQGPGAEAKRAEKEAVASTVQHQGPTAERYSSALERYVGIVAGESLPAGTANPRFRWAPPRTVADVMTRPARSVPPDATFKAVARALDANRGCAVPVVAGERLVGVVTVADLLARVAGAVPAARGHRSGHRRTRRKGRARTAGELMTAPPITTTPNASVAETARLAARCRIRSLPVIGSQGSLIGMVSREDLATVFLRPDDDIRRDVEADVDIALRARSDKRENTVTVTVDDGIVTLTGEVETALLARRLVEHAQRAVGVIGVQDLLAFRVDDAVLPVSPP